MDRAADGAVGVASNPHFGELHRPTIEHQQPTGQGATSTAQQFECFRRLHRPDNADQGGKNAHRGTACFFKGGVRGE